MVCKVCALVRSLVFLLVCFYRSGVHDLYAYLKSMARVVLVRPRPGTVLNHVSASALPDVARLISHSSGKVGRSFANSYLPPTLPERHTWFPACVFVLWLLLVFLLFSLCLFYVLVLVLVPGLFSLFSAVLLPLWSFFFLVVFLFFMLARGILCVCLCLLVFVPMLVSVLARLYSLGLFSLGVVFHACSCACSCCFLFPCLCYAVRVFVLVLGGLLVRHL